MPAEFDTSSDRITASSIALPSPGTISLFYKPTWAQNDGADHVLLMVASGVFSIQHWTDNAWQIGWAPSGDHRLQIPVGNYTQLQNAWNHMVVGWDDTQDYTFAMLNGVTIAANDVLSTSDTSGGSFIIGNTISFASDCRGRLADLCIWSRLLSASEIAMIGRGTEIVNTSGRAHRWRLLTDYNNEWAANHGTNSGTTLVADDRTIVGLPSRGLTKGLVG